MELPLGAKLLVMVQLSEPALPLAGSVETVQVKRTFNTGHPALPPM